MSQRQFRSDDTSPWGYGFGNSSDGDFSISLDAVLAYANQACSGSALATALGIDAAGTFENGDAVLIHQSTGSNAGVWELNRISSGAGTTSLTMVYPLINTYLSSGNDRAQLMELKEYSSFTIPAGKTLSFPAWDGSKGGLPAWLCNGTTAIHGNLNFVNIGMRGGAGGAKGGYSGDGSPANGQEGQAGEGNLGVGTLTTSNNGNGGGGGNGLEGTGTTTTKSGTGGAGGANASNGSNGSSSNENTPQPGGTGGVVAGTADMTVLTFPGAGGGGGGGKNRTGNNGQSGATAPGMAVIITRDWLLDGLILGSGSNGNPTVGIHDNTGSAGGGSAAMSLLLKFETGNFGANLVQLSAGLGGAGNAQGSAGGNGSVGRVHADWSVSISGSTTPSIDSRQDLSLFPSAGGAFLYNML